MSVVGPVLVDGRPVAPEEACIGVFDVGFQRGYGCFEAMRAYGGRIFRRDEHLERLARSAAALDLPLPDRAVLADWCDRTAAAGDVVVRLFVSGGTDPHRPGTDGRIVVYAEAVPEVPDVLRLDPRPAPWHPDGTRSELTGAKVLSYGHHLAATLAARRRGFDDALLVGRSGAVLEGPTFSIGWITGPRISTPSLDLGILASITRSAVLEVAPRVGFEVVEVVAGLEAVEDADEVFVMSTVKEVRGVVAVGETSFAPGPGTRRLAAAFGELVAAETGR
ncbi:MAG TPA: hypothetical protein ENK55_01315 [Actinobacteria bacterium]|nr:hypothetical protein [Actinomycetota bacterium]